jgi:carboxyl-terminal processing protease
MQSEAEYDSLFQSIPSLNSNPLDLPVDARILPSSGLVYIRIPTFSADYNLMAQLWDHAIKASIDNKIPGVILDVRQNSGGSGGMALDFAGYFFDKKIDLYRSYYYNRETKQFEFNDDEAKIEPAPLQYQGQVAVLVSPDCVSACEGFAYAMQQEGRSIIVGNAATAGAFGEVGRGQYKMPGDITMQFPTGRPETPQGQLLIEGKGVQPDITVPVTAESVLGQQDTVLQAAEQALQQKIGNQ